MKNFFDFLKDTFLSNEKSYLDISNSDLIYDDRDLVTTTDFEDFDSVLIAYCGSKC